jgi:UPF0271 protein
MIELSCDLGEASNDSERAVESALWPMLNAVNVACGGHAGDEATMAEAVERAQRFGVILGAHPSYPDRANFGRKSMTIAAGALRTSLVQQLRGLQRFAGVRRVKPHGALYNEAHRDAGLAEIIIDAMEEAGVTTIVAADVSAMAAAARKRGFAVVREGFADRRYRDDGSLVPRSEPGALLTVDEAVEQAVRLAGTGSFDTICIHADTPNAVERLRAVHRRLTSTRSDPSSRRT